MSWRVRNETGGQTQASPSCQHEHAIPLYLREREKEKEGGREKITFCRKEKRIYRFSEKDKESKKDTTDGL